MMTLLILIGIATTWLALSVSVAFLVGRIATMDEGQHDRNEEYSSPERPYRPLPQLQPLVNPRSEGNRAA